MPKEVTTGNKLRSIVTDLIVRFNKEENPEWKEMIEGYLENALFYLADVLECLKEKSEAEGEQQNTNQLRENALKLLPTTKLSPQEVDQFLDNLYPMSVRVKDYLAKFERLKNKLEQTREEDDPVSASLLKERASSTNSDVADAPIQEPVKQIETNEADNEGDDDKGNDEVDRQESEVDEDTDTENEDDSDLEPEDIASARRTVYEVEDSDLDDEYEDETGEDDEAEESVSQFM